MRYTVGTCSHSRHRTVKLRTFLRYSHKVFYPASGLLGEVTCVLLTLVAQRIYGKGRTVPLLEIHVHEMHVSCNFPREVCGSVDCRVCNVLEAAEEVASAFATNALLHHVASLY